MKKQIWTAIIAFLLGVSVAFNVLLMCGSSLEKPSNFVLHAPSNARP